MDNYGEGRSSVMKMARKLLKEYCWKGFDRGLGACFLNLNLCGTSMIVTYDF